MGKIYAGLIFSFVILFLFHLVWGGINLYFWTINGLQAVLDGMNLFERIYFSTYLRWMIAFDLIWIFSALIFLFSRKHYKTNPSLHFLSKKSITAPPKICVIIPTYNEEKSIEQVINDYIIQQHVETIIVVDNNSNDNTVKIAEKAGALIIKKNENKGFAHSYIMGLKEGLRTEANLFLTTEADGTYNGYDVQKLLSYIQNVDMVIGSRLAQILTEKGNQNSVMHIWGNLFLAKLIQFKYFNLHHLGIVNLTDVGCLLRLIRRSALEKIISKTTHPDSDSVIGGDAFSLHLTMLSIENDLRIIEIPVTFNSRIGHSKTNSNKFFRGIMYGLKFMWFILKN